MPEPTFGGVPPTGPDVTSITVGVQQQEQVQQQQVQQVQVQQVQVQQVQQVQQQQVIDDTSWNDPLASVRPAGQLAAKKTARAARRAAARRHLPRVTHAKRRRRGHVHTPRRKR